MKSISKYIKGIVGLIAASAIAQTSHADLAQLKVDGDLMIHPNQVASFFDIAKPWPVHVVQDRIKGGFGVMADDAAAAVFAAACLLAAGRVFGLL